jgi:hypothetical protein
MFNMPFASDLSTAPGSRVHSADLSDAWHWPTNFHFKIRKSPGNGLARSTRLSANSSTRDLHSPWAQTQSLAPRAISMTTVLQPNARLDEFLMTRHVAVVGRGSMPVAQQG